MTTHTVDISQDVVSTLSQERAGINKVYHTAMHYGYDPHKLLDEVTAHSIGISTLEDLDTEYTSLTDTQTCKRCGALQHTEAFFSVARSLAVERASSLKILRIAKEHGWDFQCLIFHVLSA